MKVPTDPPRADRIKPARIDSSNAPTKAESIGATRPRSPARTTVTTMIGSITAFGGVSAAASNRPTRVSATGASGAVRAATLAELKVPEATMPTDRSSPSGGWRDVYDEMGVDDGHEASASAERRRSARAPRTDGGTAVSDSARSGAEPCPDCGAIPGRDSEDLCCEVYRELRKLARGDGDED